MVDYYKPIKLYRLRMKVDNGEKLSNLICIRKFYMFCTVRNASNLIKTVLKLGSDLSEQICSYFSYEIESVLIGLTFLYLLGGGGGMRRTLKGKTTPNGKMLRWFTLYEYALINTRSMFQSNWVSEIGHMSSWLLGRSKLSPLGLETIRTYVCPFPQFISFHARSFRDEVGNSR